MEKVGKNRNDYKRANRGLVLKLVATGLCTTRTDLVRCTGLSKMAISNIVTAMIEQDLLVETGCLAAELGRRPNGLAVSPKAPKVAGLLIHRDHCEAIVCGLDLRILERVSVPYPAAMNKKLLLSSCFSVLDAVVNKAPNVVAIGISSIGPVDIHNGIILKPLYFHNIQNVPIVQEVTARYSLPTFLDHDNQSAVLAESLYGNAKHFRDVLYVGIGEGVGCGVLADGKPYCNSRGLPPELGHVSIDVNGVECSCGNRGCVEAYIRTPEMLKRFRQQTGKQLNFEDFSEITDDPKVDSIFLDGVNRLATAIISTINMLNSELILLGNDGIYISDRHLQYLENLINDRRFVEWDRPICVRRPHFLQDAPLMGAACNAIQEVFSGSLITIE